MLKTKLILTAVQVLMWCIAVGVGIWYLSSSINGDSITYTSLTSFMQATGACSSAPGATEVACDISKSNGCFLCPYVTQLFNVIGSATKSFWDALVGNLWILLALGFIVFLFIHTFKTLQESNKQNIEMGTGERKLDFEKWFKGVRDQGIRVLLVGAFLGALGLGGTAALRAVSDITIRPVMYVGAELSMAATGTINTAHCPALDNSTVKENNIIGPALRPFMCVVGNISTVILAGAAAGFSLMNFTWMGMGGGLFTWMAGLALVIMFLIIGFRIFFDILNVVFRLVFIIIFLPIFIASYAFENVWGVLKGAVGKGVEMLVNCATRVVAITLKVLIIYAIVVFAADEYGFSAITPPVIAGGQSAGSSKNIVIAAIFEKCEKVSLVNDVMDKSLFKACWDKERAVVEMTNPRAFDFMRNGWEFLMMMIGIFFIYFYVVEKKIDDILVKDQFSGKDGALNLGSTFKEFGQKVWSIPQGMTKKITDAFGKK
ncbi:MAG: hypothetical protein FWE50_02555 [Alphaproteobacteria bacterium]|nr:hypothetical protein [Alphaproteobacteria bacterium]